MARPLPYDQRLARILVRPLAGTWLHPNHLTALSLALALLAAGFFASGEAQLSHWAAGLFALARFIDHFDGELARLTGKSSRFGYFFDYIAGGLSYAALFAGIGIGLAPGVLGFWAYLLGAAGALSALAALPLNLKIDQVSGFAEGKAIGYPAIGGFELEDGIYLIAPITWIGWLQPFFVAAGFGAAVYVSWTLWCLLRRRPQSR